jgi:hypothetical protein
MAELLIQLIGPEASQIVAVAEQADAEISTQVGPRTSTCGNTTWSRT